MHKRAIAVVLGIAGMGFLIAGCGGSGKSAAAPAAPNTFVLSEFVVVPPSKALHPGPVTITADNVGGEVHELVIVRADGASALPKKSDGSVDEDKIAAADKVGEIADVAARSHKSKTLEFKAGKYVAFCNLVESMMGSSSDTSHNAGMGMGSGMTHVHFAEGMVVPFTVS